MVHMTQLQELDKKGTLERVTAAFRALYGIKH